MNYIFNPTISPAIVAGILSIALLFLVSRSKILDAIRTRLFTRTGFFWTVNVVFMAVSVLHAGIFFGITGNGHDLPGIGQLLGFTVSFFLDLVTVILMQAMLEARYRGEGAKGRQFLFFIVVCCATSTFANLAISLNDFNAKEMLPHAPLWIQTGAPYVLASFPLFVIMMSIAAEMIVNVRPLDSLDEQEYETDEQKRIKILEIRNTYLQKQANEELRTLTIRAQMKANKRLRNGKISRSFRWPWEASVDTNILITEISEQFKALYSAQPKEDSNPDSEIASPVAITEPQIEDNFTTQEPFVELVSPTLLVDKKEDIEETPLMSSQEPEKERITRKLNDHFEETQPERNTDKLSSPKRQKRDNKKASQKIHRLLEKNPDLTATEIAGKAKVSRSYAGKIKAAFHNGNEQANVIQEELTA